MDLRSLPKVRDSLSFLYVEHGRIEKDSQAVAIVRDGEKIPVPVAGLSVLLLGPGTSVSHGAMEVVAACGCAVVWVGEQGVRCYASGQGETRSAKLVTTQAKLYASRNHRIMVAKTMYRMRFSEQLPAEISLRELQGREGHRVRLAYETASKASGIPWSGRAYRRDEWNSADPVNRALSAANACLYGLCHAAVIALGLSPALGFIHHGKQLSFVYDVADLYKTETSIPVAFAVTKSKAEDVERSARRAMRDRFQETRLMERVADDLTTLFGKGPPEFDEQWEDDPAVPGPLLTERGTTAGGTNHDPDNS